MLQLFSVTQLNAYLSELIETDDVLADLWVEGEVSNFSRAASGHVYLTLKQGDAQINAVCWRSTVQRLAELPRNGDLVLARGRVAFYAARGTVQLYIEALRPAGIGLLQAQLEELKLRLEQEGLFAAERKRALPERPRRIGLVTSPTGAALQDMLHVLQRRYPLVEVLLAPCLVQGDGAPESIVAALQAIYQQPVDLIILARGGGSAEDLWSFNDERVARAVFHSPVPLITGVGHEVDTTLVDYVADLRAPTPSAAAEVAVPDREELLQELLDLRMRLNDLLELDVQRRGQELQQLRRSLQLHAPANRIAGARQSLDELLRRAQRQLQYRLLIERTRLDGARAQLSTLSPRATLNRGYALVRDSAGQVVGRADDVPPGGLLQITLREGELRARRDDL